MARSAERVPAQERSDEIGAERRWRGARSTCPARPGAKRQDRSGATLTPSVCTYLGPVPSTPIRLRLTLVLTYW